MTLKAIDILHNRTRSSGKGFFLMSEAASIDKQMHRLDYDRALGDLLELDDTLKATIAHLDSIGELDDTLILVTADHGHGFDVAGNVDTKYMDAQTNDRDRRDAVGVYQESGLSQYTDVNSEKSNQANSSIVDHSVLYTNGTYFPANWDPRYVSFSLDPIYHLRQQN
jgi:alkaline phosphatase